MWEKQYESRMAKIPVLFLCDGQNIASEFEEGSTRICSPLFPGLPIQSLQSFDIH